MKKFFTAKFLLFFILAIVLWAAIAPLLAERLVVEKPLSRADALFVLAGSSAYIERTNKAAELFKQGIAPKIVLTDDDEKTGWSRAERRNIPYVEMAQRNLAARGVPAEAVEVIKPIGSGTIYEAQIFQEKAARDNLKTVLLVTSAYHTRRTLWTFERVFAGANVELGIVSPAVGEQTPSPFYWWLFPRGWNFVAGEYVKSAYYWLYY